MRLHSKAGRDCAGALHEIVVREREVQVNSRARMRCKKFVACRSFAPALKGMKEEQSHPAASWLLFPSPPTALLLRLRIMLLQGPCGIMILVQLRKGERIGRRRDAAK